jgi:hypothetical protein
MERTIFIIKLPGSSAPQARLCLSEERVKCSSQRRRGLSEMGRGSFKETPASGKGSAAAVTQRASTKSEQDSASAPSVAARLRTPGASFDHLVGAGEEQRRHRNTERLGGLEINDEFEPIGTLYR